MIDLQLFSGARSLHDPLLLSPEEATTAKGIIAGSGMLDPEVTPGFIGTVSKAGTPMSLYYLNGTWLHWTTDVDVARDPKAANTDNRVCYTGDSKPKFTDFTLANTGAGTDYPKAWYQLGLPSPAAASSLSVAGGAAPTETRTYVYTFVDAYGAEGPPSTASTATGNITGTWNYNGMSTTNPTDCNVTKKRIYRSVTSNGGVVSLLFVAEVTLATANYADVIATTALGEPLPSATWVAPDANMVGLTEMPGGILAGFIDNRVCFSVPYQPHAWPTSYQISVSWPIVAIRCFNSNLVVMTTGRPYVITGSDPTAMGITLIDAHEPCLSKRSAISFGFAVAYASPNGLVMVSTRGTDNVTKEMLSAEQWQSLLGYNAAIGSPLPEVVAARYGGRYLFYVTTGSTRFTIIDKTSGKACWYTGTFMTPNDVSSATGFYTDDSQDGQPYYLTASKKIYLYGQKNSSLGSNLQPSSSLRTYHRCDWLSKPFKAPNPVSLEWLRVEADFSNSHPAYLSHDTDAETRSLETAATSKSPISGHAISECEIAGGLPVLFDASIGSTVEPPQQGVVNINVLAGNSQGSHSGGMDGTGAVDNLTIYGPQPYRLASLGKFDNWQLEIFATCRVKRAQLAESISALKAA